MSLEASVVRKGVARISLQIESYGIFKYLCSLKLVEITKNDLIIINIVEECVELI